MSGPNKYVNGQLTSILKLQAKRKQNTETTRKQKLSCVYLKDTWSYFHCDILNFLLQIMIFTQKSTQK